MKHSFIKYISRLAMATMFMVAIQSCSSDSGPMPEPEPDPDPQPTVANRTILVYMAAANSLGSGLFDEDDLDEMQLAATNGDIEGNRLIVFHENRAGDQILKEVDSTTGEIIELISFDTSVSALSSARMNQVIEETKKTAPAHDYGIILWSHANGWVIMDSTPDAKTESDPYSISPLAYGEEINGSTKLYMNTDVLANTLKGHDFSFVYFDCCYMACVEVLYDFIGVTPYVVASTAEVIAEGMPYQLSLPYLFSKGEADLEGAVKAVYSYIDAKTDFNRTGTFAVFDMSKIQDIADATKDFYSYKPSAPASFKPQKFMYESVCHFYDFQHIVENLELPEETSETDKEAFEKSRQKLINSIGAAVVYKACTPYIWPGDFDQIKIDHFCGMSSQYLKTLSDSKRKGYDKTSWWNDVAKYLFE